MLGALGQDQTGKNNADYILVLLVDDEDSQIELMKLNLQYADPSLTITSTSTPSSALKLVSDHAFDCIVSDYQMREMNGIQLCTEIKKTRKVPFIIYTARGSEEVAEEAFSVGVDDYVRKESELSHYKVLARRIRHVVEKNRAEVALQGSRDQLNSMLERVTDNFVSFDSEWRYVYANDSALRNLRKTRDEIIGRVLWDVFPGLSDTIYGEKYREAMEKQVPLEFEAYYQPYDMWTYVKAFPSTKGLTLFYQDVSAHKRAEEEAKKTRQTNDLLANLLEKSSQPFGVGYPDGRLGLVNEAFEKLTGYTRDELSTIDWVKVLTPPEWLELERAKLAELERNGSPVRYEKEYIRKDGSRVPIEVFVDLARDSEGRPLYYYSFITDVTERKKVEEELARLASFPLLNPNPVVEADFSGKIHYMNSSAESVLPDLSRLGTTAPFQLNWEETIALLRREGKKTLVRDVELNDVWYSLSLHLVPGADRVHIYATNVDERKRAEDELRESEDRLREITEASPVHLSVSRPSDGIILYVNDSYAEAFGYRREELIGSRSPDLYVDPADRTILIDLFAKQGHVQEYEVMVKRRDGTRFWVSTSIRSITFEGQPALLGASIDITDRKMAEEALRASNEELSAVNEELSAAEEELRVSNEVLANYSSNLENIVAEKTKDIGVIKERLEAFVNSALDSMFIFDKDLKLIDFNKAALDLFPKGTKRFDLIGRLITELSLGIEETDRYKGFKQVLETGQPFFVESYRNDPKFGARWMSLWAFRVGDGLGIINRDITERKEVEERLRGFMDSASEGFSIYDSDLRLLDLNKVALMRLPEGTRREDIIGRRITEIYPGIENTQWYPAYLEVLRTGEPYFGEGSPVGIQGDVQLSASAFRMGEGLGVVSRDITQRKRTEERLEASSLYARSLIEASLDPLVTISVEGKITDVNEATIQVTGVPREKLIGTDFADYFTEPEKASEGSKKVLAEGYVRDYPLTIRHKSGKLTDVLYNATVYRNPAGEVAGIFAAARDVTERRRLEERLQRTEVIAAVEQMGATVAHDLRGPLGQIVQSVNMIKQDPSLTPRMLQLVEVNATRSLRMIADWRSSTREIVPQPVKSDLIGLVKSVLGGSTIPGNVEVVSFFGEGLDSVRFDPDIMHRVVDNLVKNAVEAMPQGGKLSIIGERDANKLVIRVGDTGVGIPEESRKRIFSPLFTTKTGGMGLGLTYCRRAVEAQGGSIDFESKVGEGTTFTVRLPLVQSMGAP